MARSKEIRIKTDDIGKEMYMPTDKVNVPIMVNLMLIFSFLFVGAICFSRYGSSHVNHQILNSESTIFSPNCFVLLFYEVEVFN